MFLDEAVCRFQAGDGGAGCVSFRRAKYLPKGGPDGGRGGKGGDIIISATENLYSFFNCSLKNTYTAEAGQPGDNSRKSGRNGSNLHIALPVGSIIRDHDSKEVLSDLNHVGDTVTLVHGGKGGLGNADFKSATQRAPRVAQKGMKGQTRTIDLDLRLLNDVALVGFSNSGKTSVARRLARLKDEDYDRRYPTTFPQLYKVDAAEAKPFILLDLPSIKKVTGNEDVAGNSFLKHIHRSKLVLFMIDITETDADAAYHQLQNEVEKFSADFRRLPHIIAFTKTDMFEESQKQFLSENPFVARAQHCFLSVVDSTGMDSLCRLLAKHL